MIWQTGMSAELAESVFRCVRSSITATDTTAVLQAGEPVLLATNTASADGQFVQRVVSSTDQINNLYVGNIVATIAHEALGLVQCYGVDSDVRLIQNCTAAAGQLLMPELNSTVTQISGRGSMNTQVSPQFAATATGAVTDQFRAHGIAGIAVVLKAATASTGTAGASTVTAFIHAM